MDPKSPEYIGHRPGGHGGGRLGCVDDLPHRLADQPVTGEALRGVRLVGSDAAFAELVIRHLDNVEDFLPLQRRLLDERRALWLR